MRNNKNTIFIFLCYCCLIETRAMLMCFVLAKLHMRNQRISIRTENLHRTLSSGFNVGSSTISTEIPELLCLCSFLVENFDGSLSCDGKFDGWEGLLVGLTWFLKSSESSAMRRTKRQPIKKTSSKTPNKKTSNKKTPPFHKAIISSR
jgi:hypothetical protein